MVYSRLVRRVLGAVDGKDCAQSVSSQYWNLIPTEASRSRVERANRRDPLGSREEPRVRMKRRAVGYELPELACRLSHHPQSRAEDALSVR